MFRPLALATLAIVAVPLSGLAQFGGSGYGGVPNRTYFQVDTVGGNRVSGMLVDETLKIKTEEFGELEVQAGSIQSLELHRDGDTIVTTSGSQIKGTIGLKELRIRCEFGTLTIPRENVKSINTLAGIPAFLEFQSSDPKARPVAPAPKPAPAADAPDAPRPASPDRGEGDGGAPPATERPSRPSPIPRNLLNPGPGSAAQPKGVAVPKPVVRR